MGPVVISYYPKVPTIAHKRFPKILIEQRRIGSSYRGIEMETEGIKIGAETVLY